MLIPTAVPVWMPIPLLKKHAPGPLKNDTAYMLSLWVRSSPAGAKIYFTFGALANSTSTHAPGLTLMGSAKRGWTRLTATFALPKPTVGSSSSSSKAAALQAAQIMLAPAALPRCGGCKDLGASVWLDDVCISGGGTACAAHSAKLKSDDGSPSKIPQHALNGGGSMPMMMMGGANFSSWFALAGKGAAIQTFHGYGNGKQLAPQIAKVGRENVFVSAGIPCGCCGSDGPKTTPVTKAEAAGYIRDELW